MAARWCLEQGEGVSEGDATDAAIGKHAAARIIDGRIITGTIANLWTNMEDVRSRLILHPREHAQW